MKRFVLPPIWPIFLLMASLFLILCMIPGGLKAENASTRASSLTSTIFRYFPAAAVPPENIITCENMQRNIYILRTPLHTNRSISCSPGTLIPGGISKPFLNVIHTPRNRNHTTATRTGNGSITLTTGNPIGSRPTDAFTGGSLRPGTGCSEEVSLLPSKLRTLTDQCLGAADSTVPSISITVSPGNIICATTVPTFTAIPVNGGTPPAYQWQLNGTNIPGATAGTFTPVSLNNGDMITCILTSSDPLASPHTALSETITISIQAPSVFSQHPLPCTVCQAGSAMFTVTSSPPDLYQWQVSTNGGISWLNITSPGTEPSYAGYQTNTLNLTQVNNACNGYLYRCLSGCTPSNSAQLTVKPATDPTVVGAGSCTIPVNLVLSASGAVSDEVYLWYDAATGGTLLKTSTGPLDNTYTTGSVNATTPYYVSIMTSDGCLSQPRTEVLAKINIAPLIINSPTSSITKVGHNTSFSIDAGGDQLTYQWQVNTGSGWSDITATGSCPEYSDWNSSNLVLTGVLQSNNGYQYRCVVNGVCSPSTTSASATLTIGNEAQGGPYFHQTMGVQNTNVGTCMVATDAGEYYDNGGPAGNYSNNINNIHRTFCPNAAHKAIKATVSLMQIEYIASNCNDLFYVKNGPNKEADILWEGCGNSVTSNILTVAGNYNGGVFTSTHISGCLTFSFTSGTGNKAAWKGWDIALSNVDFIAGPSGLSNTDCVNSTPICSGITTSSLTYGPGISSDGCGGCVTAENFVEWYRIKMAHGGTVQLEVTPLGSSDLDFALYRANDCGALGDPIRCSFAARTPPGKTGMIIGSSDMNEDIFGDQWVKEITASTGEEFFLMINEVNKPNPNQYTLSWTLTNGASFDCSIVLPIELVTFDGACNQQQVVLNWSTLTETNNDRFIILKSSDDEHFTPIGYMDGAGNSNELRKYSFTDPEKRTGMTYYKIEQIDYDGKLSFSDVISVDCGGEEMSEVTIENHQDQGHINLKFNTLKGQSYRLNVIDINGRVLYDCAYNAEMERSDVEISTSRLAQGIYQISIASNTDRRKTMVMIY